MSMIMEAMMNSEYSKSLLEGSFTVSSREQSLINRIGVYHNNCDEAENYYGYRKQWLRESKLLSQWYKDRGYSHREFKQAKKAYWQTKGNISK